MTLGELWREFGGKYADSVLVFSLNGEDAVVTRSATANIDGETVIYMTNEEGDEDDLHKEI